MSIGSERTLDRLLSVKATHRELAEWLVEQPTRDVAYPTFEIEAALFGDGSKTLPKSGARQSAQNSHRSNPAYAGAS